jgi:hypothetical protein
MTAYLPAFKLADTPSCVREHATVVHVPTFRIQHDDVMPKIRAWLPEMRVQDYTERLETLDHGHIPLRTGLRLATQLMEEPHRVVVIRPTPRNQWFLVLNCGGSWTNDDAHTVYLLRKGDFCYVPLHLFWLNEGEGARRMIRRSLLDPADTCPVCMEDKALTQQHHVCCRRCGQSWCTQCNDRMKRQSIVQMITSMRSATATARVAPTKACPMCRYEDTRMLLIAADDDSNPVEIRSTFSTASDIMNIVTSMAAAM